MRKVACLLAAALSVTTSAWGGNGAAPAAEPVLERPTLRSLGAYWIVRGDDNKNARVAVEYRKAGEAQWRQGPPMFRVEKGAHKTKEHGTLVNVPADGWLFAGSILLLQPETKYEMKLTLSDPDGGEATRTLSAQTIGEPAAPNGPVYHVAPGEGGGSGKPNDPYRGIAAAEKNAKPGDTFLLHKGVYGAVVLSKGGEKGRPIVWRGAGDGEAVIDGNGAERGIQATGLKEIWFEGLTVRNAKYAIVAHESEAIVVRRCHIHGVEHGVVATKNSKDTVNGYFIADNLMEGPSTWPRSQGIEDARGVQITGAGHVVAYNRIKGFGDAIDTMPSMRVEAIDFHNNDVSELTDDGIEFDYAQRNVRCFENRLTNVYQGISVQPLYGGPAYIFRNVMYNVCVEPFKMHNGPSGAIMMHNTVVKKGGPLMLNTSKAISNCVYRNNLFVGTADRYAFACEAQANGCDYDYDGFAGGPFAMFMKWNGVRYGSLAEVKEKAPVYKHAVEMENKGLFASGVLPPEDENVQVMKAPDLRLAAGTPAVDAGEALAGFNDGFSGKGPDLGAYEIGAPLPHYGIRERRSPMAR